MFRFSAAYELQRTALDPDYGLFICYQMPVDKHKGLNTCLCLLRKNLNNFAELSAFDLPITKIIDRTQSSLLLEYIWPRAFITSILPHPFEIACPEQFGLCLNTFRWIKDNWTQPTGGSLTNQSTATSCY